MAINGSGSQQIKAIFAAQGVCIKPCEAKFLNTLLGRERLRTKLELVDAMWGDDEDGGPLNTDKMLNVMAHHCRKHIARAGIPWRIETEFSIGYRLRYVW